MATLRQDRQSGAGKRQVSSEASVQKPSHGRAASSIMRYRLVQMGSAMGELSGDLSSLLGMILKTFRSYILCPIETERNWYAFAIRTDPAVSSDEQSRPHCSVAAGPAFNNSDDVWGMQYPKHHRRMDSIIMQTTA